MNNIILVVGGTGDLGFRVIQALRNKGAAVVAVVRPGSKASRIAALESLGTRVMKVDMMNVAALTQACEGATCVVSALAGLQDAIVDGQIALLHAAVAAGVPRFVPSDFSSDFTRLPEGENRNFDLRKAFHKTLDAAPIAATAIMNGAFTDILAYNTPVYNVAGKTVAYWGDDAGYKLDFTTKDDTAAYTAEVALDADAPEILRIASFRISPVELAAKAKSIRNTTFELVPMGSLESLSAYNKAARAANPAGEQELYPKWQGSQYMHSMFSVQNNPLDNDRYPTLTWATADEVLARI